MYNEPGLDIEDILLSGDETFDCVLYLQARCDLNVYSEDLKPQRVQMELGNVRRPLADGRPPYRPGSPPVTPSILGPFAVSFSLPHFDWRIHSGFLPTITALVLILILIHVARQCTT